MRVSYKQGADEIILPAESQMNNSIFEKRKKKVNSIKGSPMSSNRGSFTFFNIANLELKYKDEKFDSFENEAESIEIDQKISRRLKAKIQEEKQQKINFNLKNNDSLNQGSEKWESGSQGVHQNISSIMYQKAQKEQNTPKNQVKAYAQKLPPISQPGMPKMHQSIILDDDIDEIKSNTLQGKLIPVQKNSSSKVQPTAAEEEFYVHKYERGNTNLKKGDRSCDNKKKSTFFKSKQKIRQLVVRIDNEDQQSEQQLSIEIQEDQKVDKLNQSKEHIFDKGSLQGSFNSQQQIKFQETWEQQESFIDQAELQVNSSKSNLLKVQQDIEKIQIATLSPINFILQSQKTYQNKQAMSKEQMNKIKEEYIKDYQREKEILRQKSFQNSKYLRNFNVKVLEKVLKNRLKNQLVQDQVVRNKAIIDEIKKAENRTKKLVLDSNKQEENQKKQDQQQSNHNNSSIVSNPMTPKQIELQKLKQKIQQENEQRIERKYRSTPVWKRFCHSCKKFRFQVGSILNSKICEGLVIIVIIVNSIVIAIYDRQDRDSEEQYNRILDDIQFGITIFFTIECFLKIFATGFFKYPNSYFRDLWNWVDFFTIIVGWLEFVPYAPNLKFVRTLRVLKPMRSIHAVPGLKRLINSLLKSLALLANVVAFLIFFIIFFGIVGVSFFKGKEYYRCHISNNSTFSLEINEEQNITALILNSTLNWIIDQKQPRLCSVDSSGYTCRKGTICFNPGDYDLEVTDDYRDSPVFYGMQSFNNLGISLSTIFQSLTLEGWVFNMYNMMDAGQNVAAPLYFLLIVIFGAFFLMNLILAAIMDSFSKVDKEMAVAEFKREFRGVEKQAQLAIMSKVKIVELIRKQKNLDEQIAKQQDVDMTAAVAENMLMPPADMHNLQASSAINQEKDLNLERIEEMQQPAKVGPQISLKSRQTTLNEKKFPKVEYVDIDLQPSETRGDIKVLPYSKRDTKGYQKSNSMAVEKQQTTTTKLEIPENQQQMEEIMSPSILDSLFTDEELDNEVESSIQSEENLSQLGESNQNIQVAPSQSRQNSITNPNRNNNVYEDQGGGIKVTDGDGARGAGPEHSQKIRRIETRRMKKMRLDQEQQLLWQSEIENQIRLRSETNSVYKFFYQIGVSEIFTALIILTITLNTIVIMMDKYPQTEGETNFQETANNIFYCIFLAEMIVKLIGFGFLNYLRDGYNIFDAFIILCSTVEIVLQFQDKKLIAKNKQDNIRKILLIFRTLRFLRIFKVARKWKSLNQIFSRLSNSFKQMINFTFLLSVFIFIFSLLGMELYSNVIKFNNNNKPIKCVEGDTHDINECLSKGKSLRINFDNLQNAARAVFVIIVGDDWNSVMDDYVRATNFMSIFFFLLLTIFGNIVLMTLFLAIFLREFDNVDALRDQNMVSSIHIYKISSNITRKLTFQLVSSIQSNAYFSSLRCCRRLINKLKIDIENNIEDFGETNRALNIDLENQDKEQITDQAPIDNSQQNMSKINVAPIPQQEHDAPNSPKANLYTLVNYGKAKTEVGRKPSQKSLLANMLFIDQLKNSKTLTKHKGAHDPKFLEQIGIEVEDIKNPSSRHSAEHKQKALVQRSVLADKKLTNSIAEEAKHHNEIMVGNAATENMNLFSKSAKQEGNSHNEGETQRNQTQNQQIIQHPIEQSIINNQESIGDVDQNNQLSNNVAYVERQNTLAGPFSGRKVIKKMVNIFNQTISQKTFEEEYLHQIEGNSLFILSKSNKFRIYCLKIVESKSFKFLTFCLIILSTVTLAMQDPLSDPNSNFNNNLYYVDLTICLFFVIECFLKTIGRGFYFNGKYAYLSEGWNKLDFIVVIMSILSFFQFESIKVTKALRNLRVIRPLRMITKNKGLKIAVESLANSIKGIVNITILTVLVYFVFGILGVNFFKGLYFKCYTDHLTKDDSTSNLENLIDTKWDCISSGGEWINRKNRFDNVFNGAFVLFQISTTEGWYDVMMQAVDSTDIDYAPKQDHSPLASLFFISFIFIGGQFTMNLFQSVVISTYMLEKEQLTNNDKLTEMQQEWVKTQIKCYNSKPIILHPHVKEVWRMKLIKFTTSMLFDQIVFILIAINTLILSLNWFLIDHTLEKGFEIVNDVFTAFFTFEALIKIVANGKLYFKENWNLFDFFTLLFTYVQLIYQMYLGDKMSIQGTFVRVLKFLRALRIVRRAERLKKIATTLILSLPSMAHIAFLLFLLVIFYSMLGMNLFGRIMLHDALNEHANFQNFGTSFLTMMRCSTGEGWNDIMLAVMDQSSVLFQCQELSSYEDDIPENNGQAMQCGNYWVGLGFFLSYMMFVSQIFLNLFIAIILDGFDDSKQEQSLRINDDMVRKFQRSWADFDPEGTGYILVEDLENLICSHIIDKTHWIRGGEVLLRSVKLLKNFICLLELPMYHKYTHYSYYDVMSRFAQTIFKVDFEKFVQDHYNRINRERNLEERERQMTISDDLKSMSSRTTRRSRTQQQSMSSSLTLQDQLHLLEAGVGSDDLDDLGVDDMQWMAVRDMLIFENFEDFYLDLIKKLTQNTHESIGLSEDLYRDMMNREGILRDKRDKFDSRIFSLLPSVVRSMKRLVANARERQKRMGTLKSAIEAKQEIDKIQLKVDMGHVFKTQLTIPLPQNDKNREDMFQIFAKTMDEEPQSQSPSSGLNWVKQNVKRAITLMKIQNVQKREQIFQSKSLNPDYFHHHQQQLYNNNNADDQPQQEVDLQSLDQGQQRDFNRRNNNELGDDFSSNAARVNRNRRRMTNALVPQQQMDEEGSHQRQHRVPQNRHMSMGTDVRAIGGNFRAGQLNRMRGESTAKSVKSPGTIYRS